MIFKKSTKERLPWLHNSSSDPSWQSFRPSHLALDTMHFVEVRHLNSLLLHEDAGGGKNKKHEQTLLKTKPAVKGIQQNLDVMILKSFVQLFQGNSEYSVQKPPSPHRQLFSQQQKNKAKSFKKCQHFSSIFGYSKQRKQIISVIYTLILPKTVLLSQYYRFYFAY